MEALNKKRPCIWPKSRTGGFSLVEVTMALGLMSFCLVGMLGVLPLGLKQERGAADQLAAMQVLAAVESDFQNTSTNKYQMIGEEGSFLVDDSCEPTVEASDAVYNVFYRATDGVVGQTPQQMHLFISRVRPGELAQGNVLVEGLAQKRLN